MPTKPKTHQGDLAHLPAAVQPLTQRDHWLLWNWELRATKSGKQEWTKPPRQARDPSRAAKSNDPKTWGPYRCALHAVQAHKADGIGYALLGSDIGAVDLDHVRDPATGTILRWAEQLVEEANGAYCEVTVSGAGLRLLGRATGEEIQRKFTFDRKTRAGIEIFRNTARYITLSGLEIGHCNELPQFP
jgi:primase-polymerase (primpol)-like protein